MLEELGDVYYSLLTVTKYFEENISNLLQIIIEKNQKRLKKVSHGSENK